jgi:hypothetical protein
VEPRRAGRLGWRVAGIAAVLAAAAFAAWGAFGPRAVSGGNGPLFIGSYGLDSGPGNGKQPMGLIIPISSKAHATVVIDGIRLIGGAGYPAPPVVRVAGDRLQPVRGRVAAATNRARAGARWLRRAGSWTAGRPSRALDRPWHC